MFSGGGSRSLWKVNSKFGQGFKGRRIETVVTVRRKDTRRKVSRAVKKIADAVRKVAG